MVVLNKLPMSVMKSTEGGVRPCVRLIQRVLDPEFGVAQIPKPANGSSRGGVERREARSTHRRESIQDPQGDEGVGGWIDAKQGY